MLTRAQIQQLFESGQINQQQFQALVQRINENLIAGGSATITPEQANEVVANMPTDEEGFGPGFVRPFTTSSFEIPLPFTDEGIGVNAPLLGIGAGLLTAGVASPALAGTALGARILPAITAAGRAPVIGGTLRATGRAAARRPRTTGAVAGTGTFLGGGIIGGEQQPAGQPPTPPALPAGEATPTAGSGAAAEDLGAGVTGAPALPTLGGSAGQPVRRPILDDAGNPTGDFGIFVGGQLVELIPAGTLSERERLNLETAETRRVEQERGRQAFLARQAQRGEQGLQLAQQRREAALDREARLTEALLPILASPGNRFRFAANVARLQGGQAGFTPTGAFNELFRIAGRQPGSTGTSFAGRELSSLSPAELQELTQRAGSSNTSRLRSARDVSGGAIPLTGQQQFSIIPNVEQLAGLSGFEQEELDAILGELSGQTLGQVQRQSRRLAPPGGGGPRAIIGR